MARFLQSLRRGRGDHADVFAEFALALLFLRTELRAARKHQAARLRVVR